jgi:hypothetical protein
VQQLFSQPPRSSSSKHAVHPQDISLAPHNSLDFLVIYMYVDVHLLSLIGEGLVGAPDELAR